MRARVYRVLCACVVGDVRLLWVVCGCVVRISYLAVWRCASFAANGLSAHCTSRYHRANNSGGTVQTRFGPVLRGGEAERRDIHGNRRRCVLAYHGIYCRLPVSNTLARRQHNLQPSPYDHYHYRRKANNAVVALCLCVG